MIKRRAKAAGLPYSTCCHYLSGDCDHRLHTQWRNHRRRAADRHSPVAAYTKLYDRTKDEISLDEVERIKF
jgi:integrase/recombinase XerD